MSVLTPDDIAMLRDANIVHLATVNPDGSVQLTPVWVDADDDGSVLINTAAGRKKHRNSERDPRVALSLTSRSNAFQWLSINGTVVAFETGDAAEQHISDLSVRYTGRPWAPVEGQERVILRIRPDAATRSAN